MFDKRVELFSGLSSQQHDELIALGVRSTLPSGSVLFELGAPADHLYVILRGRIRLTLPMPIRGHEEDILVEESGPGETVGWSALIPPCRYTLKAAAPLETEVLALPKEALHRHFEASPATAAAVTQNVAMLIGKRLQLFQTMWLREMQRMLELRCA
ncbi:MAG: cyclic nucleotide-binding domain-containing protein [Acidobacteria bacterium]|nr:cyclic nucleotide-binding domain-containing protein [Acidobacteriota bacterium]